VRLWASVTSHASAGHDLRYLLSAVTNTMGKLTPVINGASATNYLSYDVFGRVTSSQRLTGGDCGAQKR